MSKSPKKPKTRGMSLRGKIAVKHLLENGGSVGAAMLSAGYAPASAKNPHKLIRSKGFSALLEKAGVSDSLVSKKYRYLMDSTFIEHELFDGWRKGRKWHYSSDENIKEMIEGTPDSPTGCRVIQIKLDTTLHRKIATYRHPDNIVQKGMVELVGKVRSHFAPDKLGTVEHELSDQDRELLLNLNGKTNK